MLSTDDTRPMLAIDLFAGAGGASEGLAQAGAEILAAVELDRDAAETFQLNHPESLVLAVDIEDVDPKALMIELGLSAGELDVLKACPPCQGFSTLGTSDPDDKRNDLIREVWRFTSVLRPRILLMENVVGLERDQRFSRLVRQLRGAGYGVAWYRVNAADFGVPQRRRRLITVAIRGVSSREFPAELHATGAADPPSVSQAFAALRIALPDNDALHMHRDVQPKTLARIRSMPPGGGRLDLPKHLRLECHRELKSHATSIYGRMNPDEPSPTLTTRCTSPSCGRFVHPTEDRPITLREAAWLQTFPVGYEFVGNYGSVERQIGNAVPVEMARQITLTAVDVAKNSN